MHHEILSAILAAFVTKAQRLQSAFTKQVLFLNNKYNCKFCSAQAFFGAMFILPSGKGKICVKFASPMNRLTRNELDSWKTAHSSTANIPQQLWHDWDACKALSASQTNVIKFVELKNMLNLY